MQEHQEQTAQRIREGKTFLGMELGSTRIKTVLIDEDYIPLASGGHGWENRFENGIWTYRMEDVWEGVRQSFRHLSDAVEAQYGVALTTVGSIGISAMMHGYMAFDAEKNLLVPFRTWRNTTTEQSAVRLSNLFRFNIPQRWSIAHLYQAILNKEPHVAEIDFLTTLGGYVHWKLTGQKVLGVGDASGVFPIDSETGDYDEDMQSAFDGLIASAPYPWKLRDILPRVLPAGAPAGTLTEEGAALLDPRGGLQAGIPLCPPEGDAGTGMVATNSIAARTGNISAGTSVFAMVVLEHGLSAAYKEIDMVTTPAGKPVAMVHCNNCTSDLDAWYRLFAEVMEEMNTPADSDALINLLYRKALDGEDDCGGLLSYNYLSGEPITGFDEGRPLLVRMPDSRFTLANLMRSVLFSMIGTLKIGMDILNEKENVCVDRLLGHGGFFKTKEVGQRLMAAALGVPVMTTSSAGEGGAWGIALLAAWRKEKREGLTLESWLSDKVFAKTEGVIIEPVPSDVDSFAAYMIRYIGGLAIERAAVEHMK